LANWLNLLTKFAKMTREKWLETLDKIKRQFTIDSEEHGALGEDIPGEKWLVEFETPGMGKIKMEWVEKPKLKEVKTNYANRIGSTTKITNVYDENEKINYLNIFKWNEREQVWDKLANEFINL